MAGGAVGIRAVVQWQQGGGVARSRMAPGVCAGVKCWWAHGRVGRGPDQNGGWWCSWVGGL
jgi:hypothetical protein